MTSAPYLAMHCLKQLAEDSREKYPVAAAAIESSSYMDDMLTGADDTDTVKKEKGVKRHRKGTKKKTFRSIN